MGEFFKLLKEEDDFYQKNGHKPKEYNLRLRMYWQLIRLKDPALFNALRDQLGGPCDRIVREWNY